MNATKQNKLLAIKRKFNTLENQKTFNLDNLCSKRKKLNLETINELSKVQMNSCQKFNLKTVFSKNLKTKNLVFLLFLKKFLADNTSTTSAFNKKHIKSKSLERTNNLFLLSKSKNLKKE